MDKKFYEAKQPFLYKMFDVFQIAWVVEKETIREDNFPCEVCSGSGKLTLRIMTKDGKTGHETDDCRYCNGKGRRKTNHWEWDVIGPCQIIGKSIRLYPKDPDSKGSNDEHHPCSIPEDQRDFYLYGTYELLAPPGYRSSYGCCEEGDLERLHSKTAQYVFASKDEAEINAAWRNGIRE